MIDDRRGHRWDIRLRAGDSYGLTLTPVDPSGSPVVVSSATAMIYRDRIQVDTFTVAVDSLTGVISLSLSASQTNTLGPGQYKWELRVVNNGLTQQWLTNSLTFYAPGSPQETVTTQTIDVVVGPQVNVNLVIL